MRKLFSNKNFLLYWTGQTVSGFGNWINFVGLNLFVLKIFGSGQILGLFLVVRMLPAVLFGSIGGYLADRFDRRRLMILCDALRALIVICFIFTRNIHLFFILGLLLSALDKIFISARGAYLPDIVKKQQLMEANALNGMTSSVITILGPAAGAFLVSAFSYESIFIIDSITFIVSVVCLLFITSTSEEKPEIAKTEQRSIIAGFIDEYRTAFSFLKGHKSMIYLLLLRFIDAIGSGAYNIALPIFAGFFTSFTIPYLTVSIKKGSAYGWLVGIWALGQFLGSFITRKISSKYRISKENLFSISVSIMAIGMGLTFQASSLLFAMAAIFFGGIGDGISNVIFVTMLMKESPEKIRGKVFGTIISLVYTAVAIGMLIGGWLIDYRSQGEITLFASLLILLGVIAGRIHFYLKFRMIPSTSATAKNISD